MRAPPAGVESLIHLAEPPPSSPPTLTGCEPSQHSCRWRPYSTSNDFEANAAMVLIVLFCALICALALNAAIRCFLRGGGSPQRQQQRNGDSKPEGGAAAAPMVVAPTVPYREGMELAGAEAECAICLSEFEEGEGIQVLERCKHGYHVACIEKWFCSHTSCPTCRCTCLPPDPEIGAAESATDIQQLSEVAGAGHHQSR